MNKFLIVTASVIGVLVVGFYALNSYTYNEKQGDGPGVIKAEKDFEGEADPSMMKLDMKAWIWISAKDSDGKEIKPKEPGAFTLTFADAGKFSATTDCNSMGGSYATEGNTISFSQIFSTEKYCEGSQESEFSSLLTRTRSYNFTSWGQLILGVGPDGGTATFR